MPRFGKGKGMILTHHESKKAIKKQRTLGENYSLFKLYTMYNATALRS